MQSLRKDHGFYITAGGLKIQLHTEGTGGRRSKPQGNSMMERRPEGLTTGTFDGLEINSSGEEGGGFWLKEK